MLIFSFAFFGLLLFAVFYHSRVYFFRVNQDYLGEKNSISIKAICTIGVVLYHTSNTVNCGVLFLPIQTIGFLMVAMFFFFSGYGLIYSLNHKKDYMKSFVKKRAIAFLLPYCISLIVYLLYYSIFSEGFKFSRVILQFFYGDTVVRYSWFVFVLLQLYIIFYFSFRFIKSKKTAYIIFYILCSFVSLNCFLPHWSPATIAFIFGALFAHKQLFFDKLFLKKSWGLIITSIISFAVLAAFYIRLEEDINKQYFRILVTLTFVVLIVSLLTRIELHNRFLLIISDVSYEIYLFHGLVILILNRFEKLQTIPELYLLIVFGLSFALSYPISRLLKCIYHSGLLRNKIQTK